MGYSVGRHSQPNRKLDYLDRMLVGLHGAVKRGEGPARISKAAEKVRLATLAVIEAKRALVREFPERDPTGRQSLDLLHQEQRWLALSTDAIVEEHGIHPPPDRLP